MAILKTKLEQRQSGSALVEFIVVSAVLIPIMFGIPMIGKIIDLKQTTAQASRYSAWETTVSDLPAQNLEQRFFSDASAPIGSTGAGPNALWGPVDTTVASAQTDTDTNQSQPLGGYLADTAVVVSSSAASSDSSGYQSGVNNSIQYAPAAGEGVAHKAGSFAGALGNAMNGRSGGTWDMQFDGFIRGEASAQMEGNGWLEPLTIKQGTVIMQDGWSAGEAIQARDRVRSLVPAGVLDKVGKVIGAVGNVPGITELKKFKGDGGRRVFGHVDMEPLPPSENMGLRPLKEYVE